MRIIELAVVGAFLLAAAVIGTAIAGTWQPTHTNMLLLIFGIIAATGGVVCAGIFGAVVGLRVTRGGRGSSGPREPSAQVYAPGRMLPTPPQMLPAPEPGSYTSAQAYTLPATVEPWGEVD